MYKLCDESKKAIPETVGIPYEKWIDMDDSEITSYIEQKTGKKMQYTIRANPMFTGSGYDSVLINRGKFSTMEDVDSKIDELIKHIKSKQCETQQLVTSEDCLSKE